MTPTITQDGRLFFAYQRRRCRPGKLIRILDRFRRPPQPAILHLDHLAIARSRERL